jgi:hypothetical protein
VRLLACAAVLPATGLFPEAPATREPSLPGTIAFSDRIWAKNWDAWMISVFDAGDRKTRVVDPKVPYGDA